MLAELIAVDDPPKPVVRTAFEWFTRKFDLATDEAVKVVGKGLGVGALAGGAAATGQLPKLLDAARTILQHLG
jgi:hypothetical protein